MGKTSLGQSIAKATGRKYIRMALGGVRDEAEIRGHRRTYIGSMPGKLIQKMAKVGVKTRCSCSMRSTKCRRTCVVTLRLRCWKCLIQNRTWRSAITTGSGLRPERRDVRGDVELHEYSAPLLDRMEVIRLSGYTEDEKLNIAKQHLLPKQIERNALKANELTVEDSAIIGIIRYYTREAGVRSLEREISKLCRKAVKQLLLDKSLKHITINGDNLHAYLGVQRFDYGRADNENRVGRSPVWHGRKWAAIC